MCVRTGAVGPNHAGRSSHVSSDQDGGPSSPVEQGSSPAYTTRRPQSPLSCRHGDHVRGFSVLRVRLRSGTRRRIDSHRSGQPPRSSAEFARGLTDRDPGARLGDPGQRRARTLHHRVHRWRGFAARRGLRVRPCPHRRLRDDPDSHLDCHLRRAGSPRHDLCGMARRHVPLRCIAGAV